MDNSFTIRLFSLSAGFSRIDLNTNSTFLDLKKQIQNNLSVPVKEQKLFFDKENKKPISFSDTTNITKLGLRTGDLIYISNQNAELVTEQSKPLPKKCTHSERETCLNCIDQKKKKEQPKKEVPAWTKKSNLTDKCVHPEGSKCLHCMQTPAYKGGIKYNCTHGEGGKCNNCVGKEFIGDAKHKSFDQYLNEKREKCKGIHDPSSKCENCLPPQEMVFKMKPNCPNHRPYPEGLCTKCQPPNAILYRQPYRHVDYVSFMNQEELNQFVNSWTKGFCMKQKMAWLYGYYAADPNYPDGVRAVIELIYEPPQLSDSNSCEPMDDKDRYLIDSIAESLTLECVGWIYTSIETDKKVCMTSYDVRKAAKLQQQYVTVHPSGYKVSKFITVVVKPKNENLECELECYMVSDLCQALERDGLFEDSTEKNKMQVKKAKQKNQVLSTVYMESKEVSQFDPDFCIVNVAFGVPVNKKDMNILKSYDFPVQSRLDGKNVTESMVREYFKKHKKDNGLIKYGNFYVLLYFARCIDLSTAVNFGQQIANGQIESEIADELILSLIGNV